MPDHAHLVVDGERDDSDCLPFIKLAKQYRRITTNSRSVSAYGSGTATNGSYETTWSGP